ncbi:hypothetical protein [Streptomyces sp. NPDC101234]|uniref:hypothetical protein n=1 Tax=Streptomyces sp. NPDC101234 TaxID=3366138 RepID=UPI00380666C5
MFNKEERDARKKDRAALKERAEHPTYPYNPNYRPDQGDSPDNEMLPMPKLESRRYRRLNNQ